MYRLIKMIARCTAPYLLVSGLILPVITAGCGGGSTKHTSSGAPAPPISLTHSWAADNSFSDSTGDSNGAGINGVAFAAGVSGQAFTFDGGDQYVEFPDVVAMNPHADTDRMTVGGWFFIDPDAVGNKDGLSMLISKSNGNTVGGGWFLTFDDRGIPVGFPPTFSPPFSKSIWFAGSNTNGIYGGTTITARKDNAITNAGWYHIMVTFDPSANPQAVLYINGLNAANSGSSTIPFITTNGFTGRIGAAHSNEYGGKGNDRFNGMADEIQYYNQALTSAEVLGVYNVFAP